VNPQRAFLRKIIYLAAIGILLGPLFWLSAPATSDVKEAKGRLGGKLARLRQDYKISQTQLGRVDLTSETIKLATLGMRGVAADILWQKANNFQMKKDYTNLSATLEQITKVQPNFLGPWRYQAWNLSYNVAASFDDYHDKYYWVIRGIRFLQEGVEHNENEPRLLWDIGWFISSKIGTADEKKQFRRLFKQDDDFNGSRPLELRDNWLVGKEWFRKSEELVEGGASLKSMSQVVFFSDAPMCQMNYSEALEKDGAFGEVARQAWKKAAQEWNDFGARELPSSLDDPPSMRLNDQEPFEAESQKLLAQLEELRPRLRNQISREKLGRLKPEERMAMDVPMRKRNPQQQKLAAAAEEKTRVTHNEVALRITGPKRALAGKLARQIAALEQLASCIRRDRSIVNFDYWRLRAQVEQADQTLQARKLIYQGDRAFAKADLPAAQAAYDQGLAAWRKVLDSFPQLQKDSSRTTQDDLMDVIKRYRYILKQLDEPFPKKFILQDILDAAEKK
jgi:hypothetical protein